MSQRVASVSKPGEFRALVGSLCGAAALYLAAHRGAPAFFLFLLFGLAALSGIAKSGTC